MKPPVKYAVLAALSLLIAAGAYRACGSDRVQPGRVDAPSERDAASSPVRGESGQGFFSFFEEVFRSDPSGKAVTDEPEAEQEHSRLASELNIISEKLEELEKLPEAVWYPNSTNKEDVDTHTATLRELFMLGSMVRAGNATREQHQRYMEIKMKIIQEKIEMIRISQDKAGETGDRESGDTMTLRLERELSGIREALTKL